MDTRVAVIILNWNGRDMLRRFLHTVVAHTGSAGVALYVADNGSTDDSLEVIDREFPTVKVIALDRNYGFAEGYNKAISKVKATYVVLLNSDVEVTPSWLTPLITYMDEHPGVAACQPKIRSWHNKHFFEYAGACGGFIDVYGYPFCRGRILSTVEEDNAQYDTVIPLFWATGAALFIRVSDYLEAGGLDGRFFAHMEEIDLCWRLRARGKEIVCIPESVVYHVGGGTLKKENPRKTFLNFRNNLLTLYKNLPDNRLNKVMRIRFFLDQLAALAFMMKGDVKNAKAVWKARTEFRRICNDFVADRADNMKKTRLTNIPEQRKKSILLQYYLQGRRTFDKLI